MSIKRLADGQKPVIAITEGILDAMALSESGLPAISANSAGNAAKLAELIRTSTAAKNKHIFVCMDNDKAGANASRQIREKLQYSPVTVSDISLELYPECKDAAEAFRADPERLKASCRKAYERELKNVQNKPWTPGDPVILQQGQEDYILNAIKGDIENFTGTESRTGWRTFDELTAGGLRSGLYILAATSGNGKTTFSLQLADQLAEQKRHVLFFSLEQSRFEMATKSIARTARREDNRSTLTALQIRKGQNQTAAAVYAKKYADKVEDRLTIVEGNFSCSPDFIAEYTAEYIKQHKTTPVIFIDYLQIVTADRDPVTKMKPHSTKEQIDNTVVSLKRLSRLYNTPVITICALNRSGYRKPITFESLKESGMIEHSADFVAGLQYAEIISKEYKTDAEAANAWKAEEARPARDIALTVIKNRFGPCFTEYFTYYPRFDYFMEEGTKRPKRSEDLQTESARTRAKQI